MRCEPAFTQNCYATCSINATVPISVPQPGDLVFFANTYHPGISHVGIYIATATRSTHRQPARSYVWRRRSPAIGAPTTPGTQDPHITNSGPSSGRVACTRSGEIYGGERCPLTGCAGAALKILIVDRNRDHECMVPCAFADVLPPAGATCKTPMHGRHARNEFCKHACGTLTARLRAPSRHPSSATLLGSRLLSARGRGRSNSTAS